MPWNCFIEFAIEHWFGCSATEDIGAIEIWLIEWLIASLAYKLVQLLGQK